MNKYLRPLFLALLVVTPVAATAQVAGPAAITQGGDAYLPVCSVLDMTAFDAFIAGKPTPVEFRTRYSCVALMLPGDMSTMEVRDNNSRYFARLDQHGRIVGGRFQ